jgi:hypothetical protein
MFSADPRGTSLDLWVDVVYENGTTKAWRIDRDRVGGDLAYYHWVKWMETAVLEPDKAQLDGLADWLGAVSPAVEQAAPLAEVAQLGRFRPEASR